MFEYADIVVWPEARDRISMIEKDLSTFSTICGVYDILWTRGFWTKNLSRFYRHPFEEGSYKEAHCGIGPIRLYIIEVDNKREDRETHRGLESVHPDVFDAKQRHREKGGHRVHASDNAWEADRDLSLFLGLDWRDQLSGSTNKPTVLRQDLLGSHGWEDF